MRKSNSHPTLSEVARLAGVGVGTASRVVNGGVHVSAGTMRKVKSAIQQLGYMPNHAARVLKGGRTKTIGLLVPSIADQFFASCAEAADKIARTHDSLLIVAVTRNQFGDEMSSLEVLMRHQPDGLLIVPSDPENKELAKFVRNSAIPIVTLDRPLFGSGCSSVLSDNFEAARKATLHLIEHGYKRILCFGSEPELYTIRERLHGYRQAMEEAGLQPLVETGLDDMVLASLSLPAQLKSRRPPDAVFTLKNSSTSAVVQVLRQLRVSIPSRLALLGFDDFELAATLHPSISVVQQPIEDLGRTAAELLFAQLEGHPSKKTQREPIVLPNRLVLRRSCGCKEVPARKDL
jgi:LacI family transcriptional regulator